MKIAFAVPAIALTAAALIGLTACSSGPSLRDQCVTLQHTLEKSTQSLSSSVGSLSVNDPSSVQAVADTTKKIDEDLKAAAGKVTDSKLKAAANEESEAFHALSEDLSTLASDTKSTDYSTRSVHASKVQDDYSKITAGASKLTQACKG